MEIKGIVPIIAAPFFEDGRVDYESIRTQLRYLKECGCTGATLFGIAGEYFKLSDEECEKMMEVTVDECRKLGLASVISCTCQSTYTAIQRAKKIEALGADCMMLLPPFILKPLASELLDHVRKVCRAVSIPVMLQYAPAQTGVPITPENMRNSEYAWQLFVNSGGEKTNFAYDGEGILYSDGEIVFEADKYAEEVAAVEEPIEAIGNVEESSTVVSETEESQEAPAEEVAVQEEIPIMETDSATIGIIGGADGPTSVFIAGKLGSGVRTAGLVIGILAVAGLITGGIILRKKIIQKDK